jgi:hypothetical protein
MALKCLRFLKTLEGFWAFLCERLWRCCIRLH